MQTDRNKAISDVAIGANLPKILALIMFLFFLWGAVYLTKKTAGHFAEVALSLGRKGLGFGLGVATGFAAKRALPKLGKWSEAGGQAIGKVQTPFLRGMLRTPAKILRRTATAGRKQVVEAQGRIGAMTSPEIQRAIGAGEFGEADLAGAMLVLQSRGQTTQIPGITGYGEAQQLAGKNTIRRLGLDITGFLRGNPGLARPEDFTSKQLADELAKAATKLGRAATSFTEAEIAQRLAWQRVRPEHLRTMDLDILDQGTATAPNPAGIMALKQFLEFAKGTHFSELMRFNPAVGGKVQNYLDANPGLVAHMDPQAITYFQNNTSQSFGWHMPPGAVPPTPPGTLTMSPHTGTVATGSPYPTTLSATGGSGTYTWRVRNGSPPPGLTLDPSGRFTGNVSGPRGATYTFDVEADDGTGNTGTTRVTIRIT